MICILFYFFCSVLLLEMETIYPWQSKTVKSCFHLQNTIWGHFCPKNSILSVCVIKKTHCFVFNITLRSSQSSAKSSLIIASQRFWKDLLTQDTQATQAISNKFSYGPVWLHTQSDIFQFQTVLRQNMELHFKAYLQPDVVWHLFWCSWREDKRWPSSRAAWWLAHKISYM